MEHHQNTEKRGDQDKSWYGTLPGNVLPMRSDVTSRDAGDAEESDERVCSRCQGMQWLRSGEGLPPWDPRYQKMVPCDCLLAKRRRKRRHQLRALSGLPSDEQLLTLESFRSHVRGVQDAFIATRSFIGQASTILNVKDERERMSVLSHLGWMVLRGPVGAGKTHLAMAVSAAALELSIETLFATVPDLLDHLRATFAPASDVLYDEQFERMRNAELLVLDDLGKQRSTPWADEKLFQIVNYRYTYRLPTVVTLNEKAWRYLDDRVQSRLSDVSLVQMVVMRDAQDYRRRQGKNADVDQSSSLDDEV